MNKPLNQYVDDGEEIYYVFEYLYRDADNFKAFGQLLLSGKITDEYVGELQSYLDCGEYFVAEQVNIPTLYSQLWKYSNGPMNRPGLVGGSLLIVHYFKFSGWYIADRSQ